MYQKQRTCPLLHIATIMLEAKVNLLWLATVHIIFLNMIKPTCMNYLPEGTIQEGFECPIYGDNEWVGYAFEMRCRNGLVFHCAKEYYSKKFIKACAEEKNCTLGTEPLLRYTNYNTFEVLCNNCFDFNQTYNPYDEKLSSTMSQCPEMKLGCDVEGVQECPTDDPKEIYYADRKCRCDARNNYVPYCFPDLCRDISKHYCSSSPWEDINCYSYGPCPRGEERLIKNFSCVKCCSEGNHRPTDSDECIPDLNYTASTSTPPSVLSASISGLTSASTSSTSSQTTIKSNSPSSFISATSLSQSVSTTDTSISTDHGHTMTMMYVIAVSGDVVTLVSVLCCIGFSIKKLFPALITTFTTLDGSNICLNDTTDKNKTVIKSFSAACSCLCNSERLVSKDQRQTGKYESHNGQAESQSGEGESQNGMGDSQNWEGESNNGDGKRQSEKEPTEEKELSTSSDSEDMPIVYPVADYTISDEMKKGMVSTVLRRCYSKINELMSDPEYIVGELFAKNLIRREKQRDINNVTIPSEQKRQIFDHVFDSRSIKCYDTFKKALDNTKQTELLRILQDAETIFIYSNGQQQIHDPSSTTTTALADILQLNETAPGQQQIYYPSSRTTTALADIHQLSETAPGIKLLVAGQNPATYIIYVCNGNHPDDTSPLFLGIVRKGVEDPLLGQTDESAV